MDGREAREMWDQLKAQMQKFTDPLVRYLLNLFLKITGKGVAKGTDKIVTYAEDHSGKFALKAVEKDGPTKDVHMLGEFDREETEEIIKLAEKEGIKIAVSEKVVNETLGSYTTQLSKTDTKKLIEYQKNIDEESSKINKIMMSNKKDKTKKKEIEACNLKIKDYQKSISELQEESKNKTYSIVVNVSQKEFIKKIKDNYLDHDTKELLEKLNNDKFKRLHREGIISDFKNSEKTYKEAKEKAFNTGEQVKATQKEFDELMNKVKDTSLSEKEKNELQQKIKVKKEELTTLKTQWMDLVNARNLAKESFEKKTFSGEFTLENIRNSSGNLSMSMDRFDVTHFPEGYASFYLSEDEYYSLVQDNKDSMSDLSYSAFKESKDSNVEFLCSTKDVQKITEMVQKENETISIDIYNPKTKLKQENLDKINAWSFELSNSEKLQENLDYLERVHQENDGEYTIDIQASQQSTTVSVTSTLTPDMWKKFDQFDSIRKEKAAEKEYNTHMQVIQSDKVYDFVNTKGTITKSYTKEQEAQLSLSESIFLDENSKYYNPKFQEFLESHDLSAGEMKSYKDGFMQGLSLNDAESIYNQNITENELDISILENITMDKDR